MKYTDQLGRDVEINSRPKRIVSLVPSQTELLYDLGLEKEVVGISRFCVHPWPAVKNKTKIGGTKDIERNVIDALVPDLIIANKEENRKEDIDELAKSYPVWISDVNSLNDALEMIARLGLILEVEEASETLIRQIQLEYQKLRKLRTNFKRKTAYFIWKKPYMLAGSNTFIDSQLSLIGLQNIVGDQNRYPELSIEEVKTLNPELILLSSEPYPFKERDREELQASFPHAEVKLVDGELFSWYGSRLKSSPEYFINLFD